MKTVKKANLLRDPLRKPSKTLNIEEKRRIRENLLKDTVHNKVKSVKKL